MNKTRWLSLVAGLLVLLGLWSWLGGSSNGGCSSCSCDAGCCDSGVCDVAECKCSCKLE